MRRDRWSVAFAAAAVAAFAIGVLGVATAFAEAGNAAPAATGALKSARVLAPDHLRVQLDRERPGLTAGNFRFTEERSPDVPIEVKAVEPAPGGRVLLTVGQRLDPAGSYQLELDDPPSSLPVRPAPWALLLTVVVSAALINNFVFTRYLGLCIFFGVTKKRDTAVGMGITFTAVMVLTAMMSWAIYSYVMVPHHLKFLEIIVFIGVVAFVVQFLDTMLKKTHRTLHQRWGIYLVLITTNCIILAVPLLNAAAGAGPADAVALAVGSGVGFALALFLMSCAREKMELARVPASFQGLPIAFALAGLFALAFMGFSGLNFLR
jgi:Na+-translocating ferredoxin:NAD+ oxidoreductase subunit A